MGAEIAFLTRALKAQSLAASVPRLADRARAESWTHEELLACLHREVAARESHGGEGRIRDLIQRRMEARCASARPATACRTCCAASTST